MKMQSFVSFIRFCVSKKLKPTASMGVVSILLFGISLFSVSFGKFPGGDFCPIASKETPCETVPDPILLKFAQISDDHYRTDGKDTNARMLKESPELLADAMDQISEMNGVQFVFFSGDFVDVPTAANFKGFFQTLKDHSKIPAYLILGNHDVGVVPKQSKKDTLKHIKHRTRLGFNIPNKGYYSFTPHPSVLFVALDGTTDQKVTSNGFLPDEQLNWLKDQLESNPTKLVLISLHFPPVEPSHSRNHQIVEPDLTKFMEILESHPNVTAVFTGHYHAARITQQKGIVYFAAPALVEYPNAYRVFTLYANGKIKAEWVPTRLKDIQKESFSRSAWPQAALGNPEKDHSFFGSLRFVPNSAAIK